MATITLELSGGATARADLFVPGDLAHTHGGLVVVHEWWGLNDEIRSQSSRFAGEGFVTLAVDLYGGESTDDMGRAMALSSEMKTPAAMRTIQAAVDWLRARPGVRGAVGVTGFCLGGAMSLAAAANVEGLAAALPFYGTPKDEYLHVEKMRCPIQGHYGANDPIVSVERVRAIRDRVNAAGGQFELHFYAAGHAFMRKNDPNAYDEAAAMVAWPRAIEFLQRALGAVRAAG